MKVYIAQLKCPNNHCLYMAAGEFESLETATALLTAEARKGFQELMDADEIWDDCGVCHSNKLHVEVTRINFKTLEEAAPVLIERSRRIQAATRFIKESRN